MPLITVRELGSVGRYGNQLFLYCFARGYAERYGCDLQTSDWIGRKIFESVNEPLVTDHSLPQAESDATSSKPLDYFFGQVNIDIKIYAQHQTHLNLYSRAKIREWLKVKSDFDNYAPHGTEYSAAHLRRGDYVTDAWLRTKYCEVSEESYDRAIKQFKIPEPVFKVREGWRPPFKELEARGIGWLPDWLLLRNATHLLRGNSSFSVWASWCGNAKTYSPVVGDKVGFQHVSFEESNEACTAGQFKNQSRLCLKES